MKGATPVVSVLVAALFAQLVTPALARPSPGANGDGTATQAVPAADTSARAAAGSAPAQAPPPLLREEHYWANLVRACTANARHVRLHFSGRTAEIDHVAPEAAGVRFRAPHMSARSGAITEAPVNTDTLVAWNDVSKVEVRNVSSAGEGAATGAVVGLAVGLPFALAAALVAAIGSIFSLKQQDSEAGGILLGAAALGLTVGAAVSRHANGGWVTCCERDTSAATPDAASIH
jgi:hypothetical protein